MGANLGTKMNAGQIAEIIVNSNDIAISVHTGPDGDAIGSMSALLSALRKMGKNVVAVMEAFPHRYREINGAGDILFDIPEGFRFNTFISLDCGDKARLGRFEKYFDEAPVRINIDHHASNNFFGSYNYVDENACATSEMVYNIFQSHEGFCIDKEIASALYAGILYDTGGFRHACTTSETYFIAGKLIEYGADFSSIYNKLLQAKRFEEIQILSVAFKKMTREFGGKLVWTSITSGELLEVNARPSDLDKVVEYCKSVEDSKIAAFFYQVGEGEYKISLRSEPEYDVSLIAMKFGGGGHKNAAGATFRGEFSDCVAAVKTEVEKVLSNEV